MKKIRPMKEVPLDERRQILIELQTEKSVAVRERHGVSANTISHIRFFHGQSSAKSGGYYYKDLLAGAENPVLARIKELKGRDMTSGQVAAELKIPLEKVNMLWAK